MSRIFALVAVAVLLFGGVLVADLALQNDANTPDDADLEADQEDFAEAAGGFVDVAPVALFVLAVAVLLGGTRALGGVS